MNNRQKTYILVAGVLLVWGVIAVKIATGLTQNDPVLIAPVLTQKFTPPIHFAVDSFSIQNIPRDPFLGTFAKPKKKSKKPIQTPPRQKPQKQISFAGIVQKTDSKTPVFIVTINDREYIVKKGQTVDSVTLVSGTAKKIMVRYDQKLQTINRP